VLSSNAIWLKRDFVNKCDAIDQPYAASCSGETKTYRRNCTELVELSIQYAGYHMILLTRKVEFSSSHFYRNPAWSEEENLHHFGKCANVNGHGHNYALEVTVAGEVDPVTGFVVDLKLLKEILEREVVSVYDHRHLNYEVPEFASVIPTTENMAVAIWKRLEGKVPGARLKQVRVYEMDDLFADYYGETV